MRILDTKVVVTFNLRLPKSRPLNGFSDGLDNQRPVFWWLDFGEKWLEFISQSQIKGDYNFTIVVLGTAQG